ncbi:GIY-YIG nuclease family protein [Sphingopyxis sp. DBS4]|uniref:GIY-YIG nuclease family protein n=1 Tax=Sphingopyxis sp. DBS4 TaxID=2968500 RepID=UPI00214C6F90|nr:GIY-YIG nuclease family protein [Sphingopyxis sp. DBS4]
MSQTYHVYVLASGRNGTLYTGVTGDLARRMGQHRNGEGSKFAAKYGVDRLVHAEAFSDVNEAIAREKAIKKWRRAWKLELIEHGNPQWLDLFDRIND